MKKEDLPNIISVFPLSNFIIFPKTSVNMIIYPTKEKKPHLLLLQSKSPFSSL